MVDRTGDRGGILGATSPEHPIFAPLRGAGAPLGGARFYRYPRLTAAADAQVVAQFDDGLPALLERQEGTGRVLMTAMPLDETSGDFPIQPTYLPFLRGLVLHAAGQRRRTALADGGRWLVGAGGCAKSGSEDAIGKTAAARRRRQSMNAVTLDEAGFYTVYDGQPSGDPLAVVAVNPPAAESDLTPMAAGEILVGVGQDSVKASVLTTASLAEAERRQSIWRTLLLLAAAALGVEAVMSSRGWRGTAARIVGTAPEGERIMSQSDDTPLGRDTELRNAVATIRRKWRRRRILEGAPALVAAAIVALLAGLALRSALGSPTAIIVATRSVGYVLLALVGVWCVVLPAVRRADDEQIALYVEEQAPELRQLFLSAVHELHEPASAGASPALRERLIQRALDEFERLEHGAAIERPRARRALVRLGALALAGALLVALGPAAVRDIARILFVPWSRAAAATLPALSVSPGNVSVPRGAALDVAAELHALADRGAEIVMRPDSAETWTRIPMVHDSTGVAIRRAAVRHQPEHAVLHRCRRTSFAAIPHHRHRPAHRAGSWPWSSTIRRTPASRRRRSRMAATSPRSPARPRCSTSRRRFRSPRDRCTSTTARPFRSRWVAMGSSPARSGSSTTASTASIWSPPTAARCPVRCSTRSKRWWIIPRRSASTSRGATRASPRSRKCRCRSAHRMITACAPCSCITR